MLSMASVEEDTKRLLVEEAKERRADRKVKESKGVIDFFV